MKPRRLQEGDTIAVLSPSWGGPAVFPHIYEHGLDVLRQEFGLLIKEYPTTRADPEALYRNPQARARDVNHAFADPEVKAIFASIGGDESVRLLPYLDADLIRQNPKILMGYSDTTTLLTFCNQLGLITFHGPSIMAGFSQLRAWPVAFAAHVRHFLFEGPASYRYRPYEVWSEGYPDWRDPQNTGKVNPLNANETGWRWVQGQGRVDGVLFGGCIEVLEFLKATPFWPDAEFWNEKILFLETSEDAPPPREVKRMLRNYGMQGVFDRVKAILLGRPTEYSQEQRQELVESVVGIVAAEFGHPDMPIVADMDFGHTDPQFILPLGGRVALDCSTQEFSLIDRVVH